MANAFTFNITAVDKATQNVRNIKARLAEIGAPVAKLQTSFKAFSKETGLDKVGKGFSKVSTFADDAAGALSKVVAPLGLVTGATTVGGVLAVAQAFSKFSFGVDQAAISLSQSTDQVQQWRLVNQAMGIDAQASDAAFSSLGDTIEDALYGRNGNALQLMNAWGLTFKRTASGAIDTSDAMIQLSGVIQKLGDPVKQRNFAKIFGVEAELAELRKGPLQVRKDLEDAAKSGGPLGKAALARGEQVHNSFTRLTWDVQSLGSAIAALPATGALIDLQSAILNPSRPDVWKSLKDNLKQDPGALMVMINPVMGLTQMVTQAAWGLPLQKFGDTLKAGVGIAWSGAIDIGKAAWTGATQFFANKWREVGSVFTGIKQSIARMWADVETLVSSAIDRITAKMDQLKAVPKAIWDKVASAGQSAEVAAASTGKAVGGWVAHEAAQVVGAVKRNNPGNLRPANGNGFVTFPNLTAGVAAMGRQLQLYQDRHGLNTIAGIVNRWAPPSENNTAAYIADVSKWTGFNANQNLNLHDPKTLSRLEAAMMRQEQGRAVLTPEQVQAAIGGFAGANAGGGAGNQSGAPAAQSAVKIDVNVKHNGTSAMVRTTSSGAPVTASARIEKSMPSIAA